MSRVHVVTYIQTRLETELFILINQRRIEKQLIKFERTEMSLRCDSAETIKVARTQKLRR